MGSQTLDLWRDRQSQRLFDRFLEDWGITRPELRNDLGNVAFKPSAEVTESKSHYLVKFDLPGLSKDQIKIDLHDGYLTVTGERKEERKEDDKKRHFTEVYYGSFTRSFLFPTQVDAEKVEAKYENGVLQVNVPKLEASRARQISIK